MTSPRAEVAHVTKRRPTRPAGHPPHFQENGEGWGGAGEVHAKKVDDLDEFRKSVMQRALEGGL